MIIEKLIEHYYGKRYVTEDNIKKFIIFSIDMDRGSNTVSVCVAYADRPVIVVSALLLTDSTSQLGQELMAGIRVSHQIHKLTPLIEKSIEIIDFYASTTELPTLKPASGFDLFLKDTDTLLEITQPLTDTETNRYKRDENGKHVSKHLRYGKLMGYASGGDPDDTHTPMVIYMKEDGSLDWAWVEWTSVVSHDVLSNVSND